MTIEARTYCDRGHELTSDNLYTSGSNRSCRICTLERSAKRYSSLSVEEKETVLYRQAIRQTGRTKDEYEKAYPIDGLCAICRKTDRVRLCSDHDHSCCCGKVSCGECVRGFLCRSCNQGIGFLLDSPELLRKAAAYIETWRRLHDERAASAVGGQTSPRQELSSPRFDG